MGTGGISQERKYELNNSLITVILTGLELSILSLPDFLVLIFNSIIDVLKLNVREQRNEIN